MQRFWQFIRAALLASALTLFLSILPAQAAQVRYFYILQAPSGRFLLRDFRPGVDKIVFNRSKGLPVSYYGIVEGSYLAFEGDDTTDVISRLRQDALGDTMIDLHPYGTILLEGVKLTDLAQTDFIWIK
jgi:hypothetical protein